MYRGWANNRHMQLSELAADQMRHRAFADQRFWRSPCAGAGGRATRARGRRGQRSTLRHGARASLPVAPLGDIPVESKSGVLAEAFEASPRTGAIVRRYRSTPSPLVRNMNGSLAQRPARRRAAR